MLSRVTHLVLVLAVAALTIALVRVSNRSVLPAPVNAVDTIFGSGSDSRDDVLLLTAAAFTPFDPAELDAPSWRGADDQAAVSGGEASVQHSSTRGGSMHDRRDGDRERGDGRSGGPGMPTLTAELAARCIEIAHDVDPELAKRLSDAQQQNPEEFEQTMRAGGFGRRLLALAQLKTHDPILYGQKISELSSAVQIERTSRRLRDLKKDPGASSGKIAEVEMELRNLLVMQLAMSIKARGDMLCRFDERTEELKKDLAREASNFQETIDNRLRYLGSEPTPPSGEGNRKSGEQPPAEPAKPDAAPQGG